MNPYTHLEQLFQKRDEVRPLPYVIERTQALLDLLRVLLVLRVRSVSRRSRSCVRAGETLSESSPRYLARLDKIL